MRLSLTRLLLLPRLLLARRTEPPGSVRRRTEPPESVRRRRVTRVANKTKDPTLQIHLVCTDQLVHIVKMATALAIASGIIRLLLQLKRKT
jgi:hypothetical protein